MKTRIAAAATATLVTLSTGALVGPAEAHTTGKHKPVRYDNCTALTKHYPKGVALTRMAARREGARYAPKVYRLNTHSDRDKDRVACER